MALEVIGHGIIGYGYGAMSLSLPLRQEGDILLMVVSANAFDTVSVAGWTPVVQVGLVQVFYKRATSSESAPSVTGFGPMIGRITSVRGALETGNPFDTGVDGTTTSTGSTITIPDGSAGTSVANCLILYAIGCENTVADPSVLYGFTNADLTSLDLQYSATSPVDGGIYRDDNEFIVPFMAALVTGFRAPTGAFANIVINKSSTTGYDAVALALLPAIGGGGSSSSSSSSSSSGSSSGSGSGSSSSESSSDGEVTSGVLQIDTWEFDSPEPVVGNRNPVDYYIATQWMNNGLENQNKKIEAITVTAKVSDNGKVEIFGVEEEGEVDTDDIENGTSPNYTLDIAASSKVVTHARVKGGPKNMRLWALKYSGTWDGTNERDRLDKIVVEVNAHGTVK